MTTKTENNQTCDYIHFFEIGMRRNTGDLEILDYSRVDPRKSSYVQLIQTAVTNGAIPQDHGSMRDHPQVLEAEICMRAQHGTHVYVLFLEGKTGSFFGAGEKPISSAGDLYGPCKNYIKEICSYANCGKVFEGKDWVKAPKCQWASFKCDHGSINSNNGDKTLKAKIVDYAKNEVGDSNIAEVLPERIYMPLYLNLHFYGLPQWISGNHLHADSPAAQLDMFAKRLKHPWRKSKFDHHLSFQDGGPFHHKSSGHHDDHSSETLTHGAPRPDYAAITHGGPHPDLPRVFFDIDFVG